MDPSFGPEGGRLQDVVFCTAASGEAMSKKKKYISKLCVLII